MAATAEWVECEERYGFKPKKPSKKQRFDARQAQQQQPETPKWKASWNVPEPTVLTGADKNIEVLTRAEVDMETAKCLARVLAIREAQQRYIALDHSPKAEFDAKRAAYGVDWSSR